MGEEVRELVSVGVGELVVRDFSTSIIQLSNLTHLIVQLSRRMLILPEIVGMG